MNIISSNPFKKIIYPKFKEKTKMINFLESSDVKILLNHIVEDVFWYTMFRLFIYVGLRRGKLLAINKSDLDFKNNTVNINKTLTTGEDYKVIVTTPKTKESIALLEVDNLTMLYLRKLCMLTQGNILFPNKNGDYLRLSTPADKLDKIIKETGIKKIRLHDLRHTHASLLFASGANVKEVQKRMRHSKLETTMDIYTHVTKENTEKTLVDFVKYMEM